MDILRIFGTNLREFRNKLEISQEELADICGLHRTYISDLERFQRNIALNNIQKIADALDIEAYRLLMDKKE